MRRMPVCLLLFSAAIFAAQYTIQSMPRRNQNATQ